MRSFLLLVLAAVAVGCIIGAWTEEDCPSSQCCCSIKISSNTTETTCYAPKICEKANGTCSSGTCYVGSSTKTECTGDSACCCSYNYNGELKVEEFPRALRANTYRTRTYMHKQHSV